MITAGISEPSDTFDGKVGMLYHGEIIPARRNSVRRPAGTPEIHPIVVDSTEFYNSQTKIHHDLEKTGILDMIARVMNPQSITYIQMDNAPSHGVQTQRRLSEYCDTNHLMVQYTTQPYLIKHCQCSSVP